MLQVPNLIGKFATIDEYWPPNIVGRVNDQYVKVAKALGEVVWHQHDHEDEFSTC